MTTAEAERYAARFQDVMTAFLRSGWRGAFQEGKMPRSRLFLLFLLDARGPMRVSDIAGMLQVSPPAVTGLTNELEKEGYCRRTDDPSDRRVTLLELTPAGREVVADAKRRRLARAIEILRHFEPEEIDIFIRTVSRMLAIVQADAHTQGHEKEGSAE